MSEPRLNKEELLEIATAIADGEASGPEIDAFVKAAESDTSLIAALESEKKIKQLLGGGARMKAPDHLTKKILTIISEDRQTGYFPATNDFAGGGNPVVTGGGLPPEPASGRVSYSPYLYMAAAILLAGMIYLYQASFQTMATGTLHNIEELTYKHYTDHGGTLIPATFIAENTVHAEEILNHDFNINLIVPELAGASFSGVVYAEFVSDYHTPLLEYTVGEDDHIYVFAFCLEILDRYGVLERDDQAVVNISDINDVHIKEIEGMHVVSWKWNEIWYSAISNHDGQTLASMLPKH